MPKRRIVTGVAASFLAAALLGVAAFVVYPSDTQTNVTIPQRVLANIRPGDLIFREGTELVSHLVMSRGNGQYSHVGMLIRGNGGWQVIEAVPAPHPDGKDAVMIQSLAFFMAATRSDAVAIYHVDATAPERRQAVAYARNHLGQPFGIAPGHTYCTEFVWQAWRHADVPLEVEFSWIDIPLMPGEYLLPGDLRASPQLHKLWSHQRPH